MEWLTFCNMEVLAIDILQSLPLKRQQMPFSLWDYNDLTRVRVTLIKSLNIKSAISKCIQRKNLVHEIMR